MRTTVHKTPQQLGELIVAAYDEEVYSTDPRERLRLRRAVLHMLRRMRKPSHAPKRLPSPDGCSS